MMLTRQSFSFFFSRSGKPSNNETRSTNKHTQERGDGSVLASENILAIKSQREGDVQRQRECTFR